MSAGLAANASAPIVVTFGNSRVVTRVFLKAWAAIFVMVGGKVTDVKFDAFAKMPLGRVVIGPKIVTEVRAGQLLKIEGPSAVRPL